MNLKKRFVDYYAKGFHKTVARSFHEQRRLLRSQQVRTVFDVGAHVGSAAFAYRRLFHGAKVFCFEPFPPSYEMLSSNLLPDKNITLINAAASANGGVTNLFVNRSTATNSLLATNTQVAEATQMSAMLTINSVEVRTITLDEFCSQRNIQHVDLLKLDAQGGELDALRGAQNLLARGGISLIYSEVEFVQFYEGQPLFHDIWMYLQGHGYSFRDLFNVRRRNSQMLWGDAIFVSRELAGAKDALSPHRTG